MTRSRKSAPYWPGKRFLAGQPGKPPAMALRRIEACEDAGDFEGFVPAAYLDHHGCYFRVPQTIGGP